MRITKTKQETQNDVLRSTYKELYAKAVVPVIEFVLVSYFTGRPLVNVTVDITEGSLGEAHSMDDRKLLAFIETSNRKAIRFFRCAGLRFIKRDLAPECPTVHFNTSVEFYSAIDFRAVFDFNIAKLQSWASSVCTLDSSSLRSWRTTHNGYAKVPIPHKGDAWYSHPAYIISGRVPVDDLTHPLDLGLNTERVLVLTERYMYGDPIYYANVFVGGVHTYIGELKAGSLEGLKEEFNKLHKRHHLWVAVFDTLVNSILKDLKCPLI